MRKIYKVTVLLLIVALAACSTACQGKTSTEAASADVKTAVVTDIAKTEKKVSRKTSDQAGKAQTSATEKSGDDEAAKPKAAVSSQTKSSGKQNCKSADRDTSSAKPEDNATASAKPKESAKSDAPKHTHNWEPVYSTRQVEKTREVAWTKCYCCGADMTGHPEHIDIHLENHEENVHYGTEYRTEVYYETEKYVSGYKCSCGAEK